MYPLIAPIVAAALPYIIKGVAALATAYGSYKIGAAAQRKQAKWEKENIDDALSGSQLESFALNSEEAAKARQWNLDVDSNKYQRSVADMQAAGVNPALAMSNGVSTAAPTAVQGTVGSGYNGNGDISSVVQMMSALGNLQNERKKLSMQQRLIDSEIRVNDAVATGRNIHNQVDAATALRTAEANISSIWSNVHRNNVWSEQSEAQTEYLREVTAMYPQLSDSIIALNLSRVGLSDAQKEVAEVTLSRIQTEVDWLPRIYAAQVANYAAASGLSLEQAKFARWSTFRTVTWSEAQSMGVKLPFGAGVNNSMSSNTPVSIIASPDGKSYEVVAIGIPSDASQPPKSDPFIGFKVDDDIWTNTD